MTFLAIARQRPRIDGIGLSKGSERADEGLDLARIGTVCGPPSCKHGLQQARLVSPSCLADDKAGVIKAACKAGEVGFAICNGAGLTGPGIEDDDGFFANITSDEAAWQGGDCRHFLCILMKLGIVCGRADSGAG